MNAPDPKLFAKTAGLCSCLALGLFFGFFIIIFAAAMSGGN